MPDWKNEIEARLRQSGKPPADESVVQEITQHLEDRCAELLASGVDESAARAAVLKDADIWDAFSPVLPNSKRERIERGPAAGGPASGSPLADFGRDLRYGWRVTRRSPLFALLAVVCLAVGIGANTTVFTIVNTLLLHPTPAANPSRLVVLDEAPVAHVARASQQGSQLPLSYANLQDYMRRQQCFTQDAAYTWPQILTLAGKDGPRRLFGELVTEKYFATLGLKPALGRFFSPSEDSEPGSAPVAVLSYSAWQGRFAGARDVLQCRQSAPCQSRIPPARCFPRTLDADSRRALKVDDGFHLRFCGLQDGGPARLGAAFPQWSPKRPGHGEQGREPGRHNHHGRRAEERGA